MTAQVHMFGEPPMRAESSQWFTPMSIARRMAAWVAPHQRVLEPACGSGNLIAALLERGHDPALITGVELDPAWADHARDRFDRKVDISCADFITRETTLEFDVCLMNPPFENAAHAMFVERALELVPHVIGLFPSSIEYGEDRDAVLWQKLAMVTRRARLPGRVKYGGAFSASFDSCVLKIGRRATVRSPEQTAVVVEEVWT